MSFGYPPPRGKRNQALAALQGLFAGLQQAGQGFAQGQERRDRDSRYDQQVARQDQQQADSQAQQQQSLLARLAQSRAEADPDNALSHLDQAGGFLQGKLRPRLRVPGGESALAAFSKGAFPDEALPLSPAAAPITPGRSPAQISLAAELAKFQRERAAKVADDERGFEQQIKLRDLDNRAGQRKEALGVLQGLLEKGYTGAQAAPIIRSQFPGVDFGSAASPDQIIPGQMPERTLGPAPDAGQGLLEGLRGRQMPQRVPGQPGVDPLMERLRGLFQGQQPAANGLGDLNLPEPDQIIPGSPGGAGLLESFPVAPKVQADLDASRAALAASTETLEGARDRRAQLRAEEERKTQLFPLEKDKLKADTDRTRAEAAWTRLRPQIEQARFTLEDRNSTNDQKLRDATNGLRAMELNLQRQKFEWEQGKKTGVWTDAQKAQVEWLQKNAGARYQAAQQALETGGAGPDAAAKAMREYEEISGRLEGLLGGGALPSDPKAGVQRQIDRFRALNGGREPTQAQINAISKAYRKQNRIK